MKCAPGSAARGGGGVRHSAIISECSFSGEDVVLSVYETIGIPERFSSSDPTCEKCLTPNLTVISSYGTFSWCFWSWFKHPTFSVFCITSSTVSPLSQVHVWDWARNNELTALFLQHSGSWIRLCQSWIAATRPVKQPDKLILCSKRLVLSDGNVTLLSHSLPRPATPGTQLWVGGYSVIILEESVCTSTRAHTGVDGVHPKYSVLSGVCHLPL